MKQEQIYPFINTYNKGRVDAAIVERMMTKKRNCSDTDQQKLQGAMLWVERAFWILLLAILCGWNSTN